MVEKEYPFQWFADVLFRSSTSLRPTGLGRLVSSPITEAYQDDGAPNIEAAVLLTP